MLLLWRPNSMRHHSVVHSQRNLNAIAYEWHVFTSTSGSARIAASPHFCGRGALPMSALACAGRAGASAWQPRVP